MTSSVPPFITMMTNNPIDEVLKDADVMHYIMNDLSKPIKEKEQAWYDKLCEEFVLTI